MGDMIVAQAGELGLQFVELVVVCGEERFGLGTVLVQVLYDRPGDGYTIVSTGTPGQSRRARQDFAH